MRTLRLETIAREQLARYESYIKRLHDKVARQRTEMRRRAEEAETRILAREQQVELSIYLFPFLLLQTNIYAYVHFQLLRSKKLTGHQKTTP